MKAIVDTSQKLYISVATNDRGFHVWGEKFSAYANTLEDAKLIAASPTLLEAARKVVRLLNGSLCDDDLQSRKEVAVAALLAAIEGLEA